MEYPPNTVYIVYYKTTNDEWRPSTPTPYHENAIKLANCYGPSAYIAKYNIDTVTPKTKKIRKVRKVIND